MTKKQCASCRYHGRFTSMYRDICTLGDDLIIPDDVVNWIKWFGCASWKAEKQEEVKG